MTWARMTPEKRRLELIEAASHVFREKGYAAATVADVTREAGTAHGTFYLYFDNMEDVFDAVAHYHVQQTYETVMEIIEKPDKSAIEKIRDILSVNNAPGIAEFWIQEFNEPHLLHVRARLEQRGTETFLPVLAGVIRDAVAEGSIDVSSPEATASFLIGASFIQREGLKGTESVTDEEWTESYNDLTARVLGLKGFKAKQA